MQLFARVWILAVASLAAACPKPGGGPAGAPSPSADDGPVVVESTSVAAQSELAARFSSEPTEVRHCVEARDRKLVTVDQVHRVSVGSGHIRFHYPSGNYEELDLSDNDDRYDGSSSGEGVQSVVLLLDDRLYGADSFGAGDRYEVRWVCSLTGDQQGLLRQNVASHSAEIKAYMTRRFEARKLAEANAEAAADAAYEQSQDAALERARTMVSLQVAARGNSPDEEIWITVTARLADGSTMKIKHHERIFEELFFTNFMPGQFKFIVEVKARHDPSIRAETGELGFEFAGQRDFECAGATGRTGLDLNGIGGKYYDGQRGEDGPKITVEIADTGARTPAGAEILRYRLTCDERREVFNAAATAKVRVRSIGGKGGHAIPGRDGEGHDGGDGGDGGNIVLIVDPDVASYNVVTASIPGDGGNASDRAQTNDSDEGTAGRRGEPGEVSERRASVSIP